MVRHSIAQHGSVCFWCVSTLEKTNWAMQLFNLHVIRFNILQGEGGKRQSFISYKNHTHVHSRPLKGMSQQLSAKNDLFQAFQS